MHDIKYIRENFENFKNKISKRNNNVNIKNLLDLDKKNRNLIQEKELLEKKKKDISKSKDEKMFYKSKEISEKIKILSDEQLKIKCQPVAINSGKIWPKKGFKRSNLNLTISILDPIEPGMDKEFFLKNLQDKIYSELDRLN